MESENNNPPVSGPIASPRLLTALCTPKTVPVFGPAILLIKAARVGKIRAMPRAREPVRTNTHIMDSASMRKTREAPIRI